MRVTSLVGWPIFYNFFFKFCPDCCQNRKRLSLYGVLTLSGPDLAVLTRISARVLKERLVFGVVIRDGPDLVVLVRPGKSVEAFGVKTSASRVQLTSILFRQLRSERVDRDNKSSTVSLNNLAMLHSLP